MMQPTIAVVVTNKDATTTKIIGAEVVDPFKLPSSNIIDGEI